jgi:hypothetical protein
MPDSSFEVIAKIPRKEFARIVSHAEKLMAAGDFRQAIDYGMAENRRWRAPELERQLMYWRAKAFPAVAGIASPSPWPQPYPDPFPGLHGVPEIDGRDLTVEVMGGAIQHHGSLLVRGFVNSAEAEFLRAGIDQALQAREAFRAGTPVESLAGWYEEVPLDTGALRGWLDDLWAADSPHMMYELIELYERLGLTKVISSYLNESVGLSVGKTTLRRMEPIGDHDWHQDGAFLGKHVRTVNAWLTLSDCGELAPGLEIVGQRLPGVLQTGSHGAHLDWTVGRELVAEMKQQGASVVRPVFRAGDLMLFDQLMLHRTSVLPEMTERRYAIESWFFAISTFPWKYGPLLV